MIRAGEAASEGQSLELAQALEQDERSDGLPDAALAGVDRATAVTDKVEWVRGVVESFTRGGGPSLDQLQAPADELIALLQKLDSEGRYEDAIKLARAGSGLYALIRRWLDLLRSLRVAGRAAEALGDRAGVAWVRHELGTFQLVAGDAAGADRNLSAARELRQQLGDRAGLAVTEGNLQVLCRSLRRALHEEKPTPRRADSTFPRKVLPIGLGLALLCAGGVAGAVVGGEDETERTGAEALAPASIAIRVPVEGARYRAGERVLVDYGCTVSRGGPKLESCSGSVRDGARLDTSTGRHTFKVTAVTEDGRRTLETIAYLASRSAPVDTAKPTIQIVTPEQDEVFKLRGRRARADYSCADEPGGSGIRRCFGNIDAGAPRAQVGGRAAAAPDAVLLHLDEELVAGILEADRPDR